jgi:hypothetical protein
MFGSCLYKYIKVNISHFLSQSNVKEYVREKPQKKNDKRAAVELWRAKVPLSAIRNQLKVFERTLKRIMAFTKANSLNQIQSKKPMSGSLRKNSIPTRIQEVVIFRPTLFFSLSFCSYTLTTPIHMHITS